MNDEIDLNELSEGPSELLSLTFSLFLIDLSRTIYALDFVEKKEDITPGNFLLFLERSIRQSENHIKSRGLDYKFLLTFVDVLRKSIFEIDCHNLKWNSSEDSN